jgi:tetratricopeptide (TPR) repeat protein
MAYLLKGMRAEGIAEFQKANQLMSGPKRIGLLGWAFGVSGRTAEARAILKDFLRRARNEPFPALAIAQVYIGLGEKDSAFEWLEKAIDQKDLDLTLKWDSPYEPLRSDVRYTALLRRMKLT